MPDYSRPEALISTERLATILHDPGIRILDGSFTMPGVTPNARENYRARHIPAALLFDIDVIANPGSPLPHMLPTPDEFARAAGDLGIDNNTLVVVYDTPGLMSAGRVWWTFRAFGHDKVAVLNGGLRKWLAERRPVESGEPPPPPRRTFQARFRPETVRSKADMTHNLVSGSEQVLDARSKPRFDGSAPEPRPGLRSGHIPGSLNLPFDLLTDPMTGEIRPAAQLETLLAAAGVDPARPVTATCGSGVTAGALAFALHLTGKDAAVYDGSWAEWGMPGDTPVATG